VVVPDLRAPPIHTTPNQVLKPLQFHDGTSDRRGSATTLAAGREVQQALVEYVLIDQHEAHVEVYTRTEQGWTLREARRGERIRLRSIDCEIEVDSIYEGVLETH
jgi:hypothetical protein